MTTPRVRFAPAPTGFLHVGSARSALFNWFHARHHGGTMVLRIEDTNAELAKPEFYDAITEPLKWLGIDWDEGPYYQSQRTQLYLDAVQQLLESGNAYFCDCSRDAIDARHKERGGKPGYDAFCADRDLSDGEGVVVRFRVPREGTTVVDDVVRGQVEFANRDLEDFVIRRSNGTPVFLVANAVDDAEMGITHVVRGEDLLNTTPKVRLLWDALGFGEPPTYAHLPLLVGEDRKKLSKRKSSVALADFEAQGYIPEAMVNYLALLGWGPPDDVEIRPVSEIIELFSLEDVNKAPAFFDMKKLGHINASYIRDLEINDFKARVQPWLTDRAPWTSEQYRPEVFEALAEIIQSKVRTLAEAPSFIDWLMFDDAPTDEKSWEKTMVNGKASREMLDGVIAGIDDVDWTHEGMYNLVLSVGEANELKLGKAQAPIRVAVTGRTVGPPLFESIVLLDRGEVRRRLEIARTQLG